MTHHIRENCRIRPLFGFNICALPLLLQGFRSVMIHKPLVSFWGLVVSLPAWPCWVVRPNLRTHGLDIFGVSVVSVSVFQAPRRPGSAI